MTNVIVKVGDSFMEGELGELMDDGSRAVVQGEDWTWVGPSAHVLPAEEEPDDNCLIRTWSENDPTKGVLMWEPYDGYGMWHTLASFYPPYVRHWTVLRRAPHRVYRPTDGEF